MTPRPAVILPRCGSSPGHRHTLHAGKLLFNQGQHLVGFNRAGDDDRHAVGSVPGLVEIHKHSTPPLR